MKASLFVVAIFVLMNYQVTCQPIATNAVCGGVFSNSGLVSSCMGFGRWRKRIAIFLKIRKCSSKVFSSWIWQQCLRQRFSDYHKVGIKDSSEEFASRHSSFLHSFKAVMTHISVEELKHINYVQQKNLSSSRNMWLRHFNRLRLRTIRRTITQIKPVLMHWPHREATSLNWLSPPSQPQHTSTLAMDRNLTPVKSNAIFTK